MALSNGAKVLIATAVAGGVFLATRSAGASSRPPWTDPVRPPANEVPTPYATLDEAICQCFQAEVRESAALVSCALRRVYPDVPWPAQPGDHETVMRAWQAAGVRVAQFLTAVANGENPCAVVDDPVGPGGEEPPPPPDDTITTLDPWLDNGVNSFAVIRANNGDNPSSMAARMYGIPQGNGGLIDRAIRYVATTGFNLLFVGVPYQASAYGRGRVPSTGLYYSMGEAFRPVNMDPVDALASGEKLRRQIAWRANANGNVGVAAGSPRRYFKPWYPEANQLGGQFQPAYQDPWDSRRNPPANVLAALGWTLEEMENTWKNANPSA